MPFLKIKLLKNIMIKVQEGRGRELNN